MKTQRVVTNLTCNQNCTYCNARAPEDDPTFVHPAALRDRIERAVMDGPQELVFTGGEPTLRDDLAGVVAYAAERVETVALETNASVMDAGRARALKDAGLARVLVNLAGWGEQLDAVTRDPGGFGRTRAGILALAHAGLAVEVQAAVVRSTRDGLPGLGPALADAFGDRVEGLRLTVPVHSPDPEELLDFAAAADVIVATERAARAAGVPVRLAPGSGPPPCMFDPSSVPAHVFSLTPGGSDAPGFERVRACAACRVADRCPGFPAAYLDRWPAPAAKPVEADRLRRRLSLISSVSEQVERELVSLNLHRGTDGKTHYDRIIRVNFRCNQACRFCFVSTHLPAAEDARIERAIREAGTAGHKVTISGGEPTLNPRLADYVRLAADVTDQPVQIQTNAVRLDDPDRVKTLRAAGLAEAFVSLHGATAEVSDRVTGAPGTFARTVVGIDNLHAAGVKVILNFVICGTNVHELPDWVTLLADRWPGATGCISFVAPSTDMVPRDAEMIPRYEDVLPQVARAVALAGDRDVELVGFESMCGIPLCLVPDDLSRHVFADDLPEGFDAGEFIKTDTCRRCRLERRCYGIRRGYAALHGTDELRAVGGGASSIPAGRGT